MEILDYCVYKGRNIYSHRPAIKIIVDIGAFSETPTKDIQGFNEHLLHCFPGLKVHTCGLGYPGGFLERLQDGTYLGHVLEHCILDLENSLGFDVKYGKTRLHKEPSTYYLVFEYVNEVCALECSKVAVFILNCFLSGEAVDITEFLEYLKKIKLDTELGPSTAAIVQEAHYRGIPVTRIGHESLVRLGYGKHSRLIQSTLTDATSCIAADISSNKQLTKAILDSHNVPVPYGKVVYSESSAVVAANQIGFPVAVKPFDGNQGKGVSINLNNDTEVRKAFQEAVKHSSGVIVEQYITGKDYRILVIGGAVKAVSLRIPAAVIGDGIHSIRELVKIMNADPERGESHEKALTKIKLDSVAQELLQRHGMDEGHIPGDGQIVTLRSNGNISTGGVSIDCTDRIHPDNAAIAINASNAIGIDIAGIDMVATDISQSIQDTTGAVIEVNAAPGIRMHLYPCQGTPRNVAQDIVELLFPDGADVDFPIVSVTGTNGKTTTARLISQVLSLSGKMVGMTSTSGTFIGNQCICKGDHSGPRSASTLLANKTIDAAVLETARGGIVREGLGYDLADVAVVTNIANDHLGSDGIETLEDLADVKSLVAEAVKPDGYVVLNQDDGMTATILERVKAQPILFSTQASTGEEKMDAYTHIFADENGMLTIWDKGVGTGVIPIADIPIAHGGRIVCNIENCMAAIGALYALRVPLESIQQGLRSFKNNTGRFQAFQMDGFQILLDYAHNPAGYTAIADYCHSTEHRRCVGVIGMPGDRPNSAIQEVARISAKLFDCIYIKEDRDLRGRKCGEVADLLYESIIASAFVKEKVEIIHNEQDAFKKAIVNAHKGDLIVVLYESYEALLPIINEYQP